MPKLTESTALSTRAAHAAALAAIALLAACSGETGGGSGTDTGPDGDVSDAGDASGDGGGDAGTDDDAGGDAGGDGDADVIDDTTDTTDAADAADGSGDTDLDAGDDTTDGSGDTDLDAGDDTTDGSGDADLDAGDDGGTDGGADADAGTDTGLLCGNGAIDAGEFCDGANLGDATCTSEGFFAGELSCNSDCTLNVDACTENPCGNGVVDAGEACDGAELAGQACDTLGYDAGTLGCTDTCTLDETACVAWVCGNGVREGDEACDGPSVPTTCIDEGFDGGSLGCTSDCTVDFSTCQDWACGDGSVQPGEQCDDENSDPTDGCFECVRSVGWTCTGSPSLCVTTCGDGIIAGSETCDDDEALDGDGCDAACAIETGFTCAGLPSVCTTTCGDGVLAGDEVCEPALLATTCDDLGFDGGTTSCAADCTAVDDSACVDWVCGDGVLDPNEACDGTEFTSTCGDLGFAEGEVICASDCTESTALCVAEPFFCGDGTPIDALWVCDTFEDCTDGSDEVDCGACPVIDAYEPNDTTATATPGADSAVVEAFICPGEFDIFAIDAATDCAVNVRLRHASTVAPLEAYIVDFDLTAFRVTTPSDDASFTYTPTNDGPWFVLVRGTQAFYQNAYLLEWDTVCGLCTSDANEPNDFLDRATPIANGSSGSATVCSGDRDLFSAALGAGCSIAFTTSGVVEGGDATVAILDAGGAALVEGTVGALASTLDYTSDAAGVVYAYVAGADGAVLADYDYDVAIDCPPGVCLPDVFEPNDSIDRAADAGESFTSEICGAEVDVFAIPVTEGCTTSIEVLWASDTIANAALGLFDADANTIRSVEGAATGATLRWTATLTTEVYLGVFGEGDAADYIVDVTTDCSAPCAPDAYEFNDSSTLFTDAGDAGSFAATVCPEDLDVYGFVVAPGCTAYVNLFDGDAPANLDAFIVDTDTGATLGSAEVNNGTENITWQNTGAVAVNAVAVVAAGSGETDDYTLDTVVFCPAPAACVIDANEVNDTYPQSTPLLPGEGVTGVACNSTDDLDLFETSYTAGCMYAMTAVSSEPFAVAHYNSSTTTPAIVDIAYFAPGFDTSYHLATEATGYIAPGSLNANDVVYSLQTTEICVSPSTFVCGSDDNWETLDATGNPISAVPFVADGVSCADDDGFGNEGDWFLVTVDPNAFIEASMLVGNATTDLDLYVLDSTFATVASSEQGAGTSETLLYQSAAGGTYWIYVRPFEGAYGPYTLFVDVL